MIRGLLTNGNLSYHFAYLQNVTTFRYVKFYALSGALYLHGFDKTTRQGNDFECQVLGTFDGHPLSIDGDTDVVLYRLLLLQPFCLSSLQQNRR